MESIRGPYGELEFPVSASEVKELLGLNSPDLTLILDELKISIPKRGRERLFSQYHFDILILFTKIKEILKSRDIPAMINVATIGVLRSIVTKYKVEGEDTFSEELTEESLMDIINNMFEA